MASLKAFLILTVTVGAVLTAPPAAFKASEGKPVVAPKPQAPVPPPVPPPAPPAAPPAAPPPVAPTVVPTVVPPTAPPAAPPAAAPSYYYYYYDYPTQPPPRFFAKKPDSSCKCDEMYLFTNRCRIGVFVGYCEEGGWCCDS